MSKIYINSKCRCHASNTDSTFRKVILNKNARIFFSNKCTTFIKGYRLKPNGEIWVREDEQVFFGGETIAPWKDYSELDAAQREYEKQKLSNCLEALQELGVET